MFSRFSTVLQNAVEALAPPVPLHEDFMYHWKMVMKFYVNRKSVNKITIESTNIPAHLDQLHKILLEEESSLEDGATGPCLEYLLQHRLLDLLATLATTDCPPGMRQVIFVFVRKLLVQLKQPLLPHVSVYAPVQRLVGLCNGMNASPTEMEEIQFLCSLCAMICEHPHLTSIFNGKNVVERRVSTSSNASSLSSGFEDVKPPMEMSVESSSGSEFCDPFETSRSVEDEIPRAGGGDVLGELTSDTDQHNASRDEFGKPAESEDDNLLDSKADVTPEEVRVKFGKRIGATQPTSDSTGPSTPSGRAKTPQCNWSSVDRFFLLDALLSYLHSADSRVRVKACEGVMVVAALPSDNMARSITRNTDLCSVVPERLVGLYNSIPRNVDPNDLDDMKINWGYDSPLWSEETRFEGCRQVALFLSWLDYCDQLVRESHPITGRALARSLRTRFLDGILAPALHDPEENSVLATAFVTKCLKQISAPVLLAEIVYWLVGESRDRELPEVSTWPLRQHLLDNCVHERDDVSLETLRLFEVLIEKHHEHALHCLVLVYLNTRGYYGLSMPASLIDSWSEEEDQRPQDRDSPTLDFSPGSSPASRTLAPSNIYKVINSFLLLLPSHLHSATDPEESGYQHYVQDAGRQCRVVAERCSRHGWPTEATFPECDDSRSSDSRPEADHNGGQFYEGPFLRMLLTRLVRLPYQPYEINLQLTGLVSRLAMLPHPYLHEFILNPVLPLAADSNSLFGALQLVSGELVERIPSLRQYKQALHSTRQRLLWDATIPPEENNNLFESLIVLEEFCKELAAIAYVKYHQSS